MEERIAIQGRDYRFQRPADLETLWEQLDEQDFCADERLPYWVEIWPAGIFLAQWIARQKDRLSMDWCLDLGCGLGVSTCVAAEFTGRALGLDYEFAALSYARRNAGLNGCDAANWALMDWRRPGLKPGSFAFIWGADILYEARFFQPLARIFQELLAPGGIIWLSTPQRKVSEPFWNILAQNDWRISLQDTEHIAYKTYHMQVYLWEITRKTP